MSDDERRVMGAECGLDCNWLNTHVDFGIPWCGLFDQHCPLMVIDDWEPARIIRCPLCLAKEVAE